MAATTQLKWTLIGIIVGLGFLWLSLRDDGGNGGNTIHVNQSMAMGGDFEARCIC